MSLPERTRWEQLSPWLDELLALDRSAREQRLTDLRRSDPELAEEVAALLGAADRAEATHFMAGVANEIDEVTSPIVGKQIGAYVIQSQLGEGATGSVWLARRADGLFEGGVAVKLLHLSLLGRTGALRFRREGAILARLAHPNIARLLDAGVTLDGQPYLVLELVEGMRIDAHCDAQRLDVEQRLALFADVLAAVAHAHSHLVIHRDLKPNNIFVTADGRVKLLDFGIAKLLRDDAGAELTVDGRSVLTPQYAAPEQLQGGPVTTAADIYALGVLLFQLLAGRHPTTADAASSVQAIHAALDVEPMRLGAALAAEARRGSHDPLQIAAARGMTLPRLRRQLQGDLENIVGRSLRKDPAQRYQTAAALADDLHRHLAHEPVSARPDSLAYRCAKFARRHRSMAAAALLVVLAVTAGLAGTITQARRAQAEALHAQHERDKALRQLSYAKSSNEFIASLLQQVPDKAITTAELLAHAETVLARQFGGQAAQRAHLRLEVAALYARATYFEKARTLLQQARADARDVSDLSLQAGIECFLAYVHVVNGSADRAADRIDHRLLSECLRPRAAARAAQPEERPRAAALYRNVGVLLFRPGQTMGSLEASQRALDISRGFAGAEPSLDADDAERLVRLGRSREAGARVESAAPAGDGADMPSAGGILALGADAWCLSDTLDHCAEMLSAARDELGSILPAGHSMFGTLTMARAQLALDQGDFPRACAGLEQAVDIFDSAPDRNAIAIRALTLLARTERQMGELDAAMTHASRGVAEARDAKAGFAHSEWLGSALAEQGAVQQARGEREAARASWRAALSELRETVGDSAPATTEVRRLLAAS